jgi:protein-L-isoaspartate(D-aspartate) O-methyltransferase
MKLAGILFALASLALILCGCSGPAAATPTPAPALTESRPPALETAPPQSNASPQPDAYGEQREQMVRETIEARGVEDPNVLRAMRTVPRHRFVPIDFESQAYRDHPLPIGYGQTISQPYIVAWMTELIELKPGEKVLEIGTGSGYQAAILVELEGVDVYSIEIVPELAEQAEQTLLDLGYDQIHLLHGDGYHGWPEDIEFDAILVTAAPDHIPAPLAAQLSEGGRMVIPIGPVGGFQTLWKFIKQDGELTAYNLGTVRFVPLTGSGTKITPLVP